MTPKECERIYNEAYRAVYWTALSLLKNEADAEDVVQDTFVTLLESYDTIQDKTKVVSWLKKICANKCLNRLSRTKTETVEQEFFEDAEYVPEDFLPESIVESAERRKIIMDIIEKSLSEDVRRTIILFYFDEMSTQEIAEAMGIPQGTVLWRLGFARKKIKKEVEKYETETDTKLYSVALPFLALLFIKEAELVPLRPMPASLAELSASTEAAQAEAVKSSISKTIVSETIKKGTGIVMKKIIIGCISVLLLGMVVTGVVLWKNRDEDSSSGGRRKNSSSSQQGSKDGEEGKDEDGQEGKGGKSGKNNGEKIEVKENKGTFDGDLNALGVKFEENGWTYSYTEGGLKAEYAQDGDPKPVANYTSVNDIPVVWVYFRGSNSDTLDLSNVRITSNVTSLAGMFHLNDAKELDLSGFDTRNVTTIASMFAGCKPEKLIFGDFDTSNVTDMKGVFSSSYFQNKLDLSCFDTSKVTDMKGMFLKASIAELDISSFNTSNVTSMEGMFNNAWVYKPLDLTNFDTSKVENMNHMFYNTHTDWIDISSFDLSNVKDGEKMFYASPDSPYTVYVKDEAMIAKIKELAPDNSFQYVTFKIK